MRRLIIIFFLLATSVMAARFSVDNATICPCQFASLHVNTTNIQDTEFTTTLYAQSNLSIFPKNQDVRTPPQESTTTIFQAAASCDTPAGDYPVWIEPAGITGTVHVNACNGFSLSVTPYQATCQNQHADYAVRLENLGSTPRTIALGTDLAQGNYELVQKAELGGFETKTVILTVNTNAVAQRLPFKVVARSDETYQEQPAILEISTCQGIRFLTTEPFTVNEGENKTHTIRFQNLGKSRTANVRAYCPPFVTSNATKIQISGAAYADIELNATNAPLGTYSCTLFVDPQDEGKSYSHSFTVNGLATSAHVSVQPNSIILEQNVTRPIAFTIQNKGTSVNGSVTLTSNHTQQYEPVPRYTTQTQTITLMLSGTTLGNDIGQLHISTQNLPIEIVVIPATITFNATAYAQTNGVRIDYNITNNGNATTLSLSSQPQATGPVQIFAPSNTTTFFTLFIPDANATTLSLHLQTNRGTYETKTNLANKQPAPQTGLITFSTPVIAFAAAILLALILLYLLYRENQPGKKATKTPKQTKLSTYN